MKQITVCKRIFINYYILSISDAKQSSKNSTFDNIITSFLSNSVCFHILLYLYTQIWKKIFNFYKKRMKSIYLFHWKTIWWYDKFFTGRLIVRMIRAHRTEDLGVPAFQVAFGQLPKIFYIFIVCVIWCNIYFFVIVVIIVIIIIVLTLLFLPSRNYAITKNTLSVVHILQFIFQFLLTSSDLIFKSHCNAIRTLDICLSLCFSCC